MGMGEFIAGQLRLPSGWFGRFVVAPILNRGNAPMNELTVAQMELAPEDRVLEVGFGGGDLIHRMIPILTRGRIAGADPSSDMVALCTRRFRDSIRSGRLDLRKASVEALPFGADEFDKACGVNTIYFWPDPALCLAELKRTLRTGGRLVLTFNPRATAQKLSYTRHGFTLYEPDEVRRLLETAGFRDVRIAEGSSRLGPFAGAVGVK